MKPEGYMVSRRPPVRMIICVAIGAGAVVSLGCSAVFIPTFLFSPLAGAVWQRMGKK